MELSWIQRHALLILLRNESARVKDLTPADVPANLFSYYLDGLISAGFIKKTQRGVYQLTAKGEIFAGSFSTETNALVKEIKTVIMFYGKKNNEYLLFKWSRQPYLGQTTLPHDRLPFGLSLEEGLKKATCEKLGNDVEARYKTSIVVKVYHDEELISHMNALVYEVDITTLSLPFISRNGEAFFDDLQNATHIDRLESLVSIIESGDSTREVVLEY